MTRQHHHERRRHVRVPIDATVRIEHIPQVSPYRSWQLVPEDLGEGGLRLVSPEPFPVAARLLLDLEIEGNRTPIRTTAQVAWMAQAPFQDCWHVGLTFAALAGAERDALRRIVREQRAAA